MTSQSRVPRLLSASATSNFPSPVSGPTCYKCVPLRKGVAVEFSPDNTGAPDSSIKVNIQSFRREKDIVLCIVACGAFRITASRASSVVSGSKIGPRNCFLWLMVTFAYISENAGHLISISSHSCVIRHVQLVIYTRYVCLLQTILPENSSSMKTSESNG